MDVDGAESTTKVGWNPPHVTSGWYNIKEKRSNTSSCSLVSIAIDFLSWVLYASSSEVNFWEYGQII